MPGIPHIQFHQELQKQLYIQEKIFQFRINVLGLKFKRNLRRCKFFPNFKCGYNNHSIYVIIIVIIVIIFWLFYLNAKSLRVNI